MKLARPCFGIVQQQAQGDRFRLKVDKAKTDGEIETPHHHQRPRAAVRTAAHSTQPSFDCMSAWPRTSARGKARQGAKTDGLSYGKVVLLLGLQPILFKT